MADYLSSGVNISKTPIVSTARTAHHLCSRTRAQHAATAMRGDDFCILTILMQRNPPAPSGGPSTYYKEYNP
jgi:hypothetical protein